MGIRTEKLLAEVGRTEQGGIFIHFLVQNSSK